MNLEKMNARDAATVTPADSNLTRSALALYIGTGGNVRVTTAAGTDVTFTNVLGGTYLNVQCIRVWATNTTASGIVALFA